MDTTPVASQPAVRLERRRPVAKRRYRSAVEKVQIVAESRQAGASVAEVARRHDINANQLFSWRRLDEQGLLAQQRQRQARHRSEVPLLAVTVSDVPEMTSAPSGGGYLEIVLADGIRVRCIGSVERAMIEQVLGVLRP